MFFFYFFSGFAQYDRIGNTYEQIRDADFYKKPGLTYPNVSTSLYYSSIMNE